MKPLRIVRLLIGIICILYLAFFRQSTSSPSHKPAPIVEAR
ncbi:MAG: hypothetical protein OEY56_01955 [Cyclobacteriaceae bacterium]|nr:hypothetical protein [Cyclobacteriaceae bacterium]